MCSAPLDPAHRDRIDWLEQSFSDVPVENAWLTSAEIETLSHLRFPKRREDWRLGRWTAKSCIAAYAEKSGRSHDLSRIEIRPGPSGAPFAVLLDTNAFIAISLSHRAGKAMCALAPPKVSVGCDLELIEARSAGFLWDYFTREEQALVERTSVDQRSLVLNVLWSAKESALKALHQGLSVDTRRLAVSFLPETGKLGLESLAINLVDIGSPGQGSSAAMWRPLRVTFDRAAFRGWWAVSYPFVRTLVLGSPSAQLETDEVLRNLQAVRT